LTISPLDVRNQIFKKKNTGLKQKAEAFSDIESTLRDTMVTAQRISDEAKVNAQKAAENIKKQAEIDAKHQIAEAMKEVEKLARAREDARSQTIAFVAKLRSLLEAQLSFLGSVEGEIKIKDSPADQTAHVREEVGS
jgi:cell division initiation protein